MFSISAEPQQRATWVMLLAGGGLGLPFLTAGSVPPVSTYLNQLTAALACLFWIWAVSRQGLSVASLQPRFGTGLLPMLAALGLLVAQQCVSAAPSGQRWLPVASVLLCLWAVWTAARCERASAGGSYAARLVLGGLLLAALLSVVIAVVQVFAPSWADGLLIARPTAPGRAVGNMRQPNQLSTVLLWGCGATVAWASVRRWSAAVFGAVLTALVLAVLLTASRTGMVGIFMMGFWGLIDRRLPSSMRRILILVVPLYFLGWWAMEQWSVHTGDFFYGDDQIKKTLHGDPSSSRGRIWANTLSLIAAHPWTGVGAGRFNFVWSMTPFPNRPIAFFDHSHNLPLQLAVESGIPFALLVLGLLGWAFWRARVALFVADDREAIVARSLAFMLAVIGVHSLLEYPLWYTYFLFPTALMAGCLCGAAERARPGGGRVWFSVHPRLVSVACLIGLAVMVWVGRQYYQVAVIFDPSWSIGEAAPLSERIRVGQQSVLFGHHADYAKVTMSEHPEEEVEAFARTSYHLLDTRLMIAYAKALAARGQEVEARHVAARLREFRNPASDTFFEPCHHPAAPGTPLPFQCGPDPRLSADAVRPEVVFAPDALKNRR